MAPGLVSPSPAVAAPLFPHGPPSHSRRLSALSDDDHSITSITQYSSRLSSRRLSTADTSNISNVVYSLKRRSSEELGSTTSASLLNATHDSILDWIRAQRMSHLPPEGSSHDKVLAWAQLFVERLHSFGLALEEFAGDSYLAAQLAYGYCAILLELGKENAPALMVSFGFFYNMSMRLVHLLERTELFSVSQEIREQLVLAMSDLVTLVASVSTQFHKAIYGLTTASVSVNIYGTFPCQIKAFIDRCDKTAESMWRHQLMREGIDASKVSTAKAIKTWLAPEDSVLANVVGATSHLAHDREELTCLWVGPYLTRFLKSPQRILSINGKPGSGKTVLATVIVDYLQHPIGGVTYATLFVPINGRISAETTPRAVAKSILCQLFEQRIGNVPLLQILSDAFDRCQKTTDDDDYDDIIWNVLARAMGATLPGAKELLIVVDGIDEASCGEAALFQRLKMATTNAKHVKLITLGTSQPNPSAKQTSVKITEDVIFDDICAVIRGQLEHTRTFSTMSELNQETIVSRIAEASNGSFLWAKFATKRVRHEDSQKNVRKAVDSLVSSKTTITDFTLHALQHPGLCKNAKRMLLWLATAERPLSLKELAALASIQVGKNNILDQHFDVLAILKPVNSLVFLQDGLAYLRHGLIREAVLDLFTRGKLTPEIKDRHADFVTRLLCYINMSVTQRHELSLTPLDAHETSQLLNKYPLLDFAVRYWPVHLKETSAFISNSNAAIKSFIKVFPTSTTVLLLQRTLWEHKPTPMSVAYQVLVTDICRTLLTSKNTVTLQAIIILALLYRQVGSETQVLSSLFYEAATLANTLLGNRHNITKEMAKGFLELTASMVTSEKTQIMSHREEMFVVLVECYKAQYGESSEIVISTLNQFVEHYELLREEHNARLIVKSIRSSTSTEIEGRENELHVHLRGRQDKIPSETGVSLLLDVEEHDELIQGSEESKSYDFELSFKQAEKYVSMGRFELAEHSYIETWQRVSREYREHHSELWETRKIKAVTDYARFLQLQKREEDASSLLSSFWEEYKQSSMSVTESSIPLYIEMAKVMKDTGLISEALCLLKHCARFYQDTNRTHATTYKELQQMIKETSKAMMRSVSSSSSVTSESTLEEMVLEASKSISSIDQTIFTAIFNLIKIYTSQHRWQDTARLIKKILRGIWPSFSSPNVQDVTSPPKFVDRCVELAERLAECYHARRRLPKEEDTRMRIYQAVRSGRKVDDHLRERVTTELLDFYSRTSQEDMVISIRQEMLDDFTAYYGSDHPTVIKMLWQLAKLTRPRPIFLEYYQKIIRTLNEDSETSTQEAFEPLVIVSSELWSKGQFSDALPYLKVLFQTFLEQPCLNTKFQDQAFVRELFTRYTHCLRSVRSEFSVLHQVVVGYQSQCKAWFGATASISVQATLTLAKVCQESKRFEHEAISVYEELLQIKSSEVNRQEISAILDSIYEEQADVAVSTESESTFTAQTIRAVKVLRNRLTDIRETHGWAHEESLTKLTQLVKFHAKQQETHVILTELQEATINVLSQETSSSRLIAAASTIASNYIASNQVHKAMELREELYRQIIMKEAASLSSSKFDVSTLGRESLVFLAQFECSLRRNSTTVNDILSEFTTQYVYFENFRKLIKSKASSFHDVCVATARLYQCLTIGQRQTAATHVFDDFTNYFLNKEGKRVKLTKPSEANVFLQTLLQYFSTHKSRNFMRSVGISCNERVKQLLVDQDYETACDLALSSFKYISAHDSYRTPAIAKFVLLMGMAVAGRDLSPRPHIAARKRMLGTSGIIIQDVLHVLSDLKINLEQVSLAHLNNLIGLLGDQQDYQTLAWLLTVLWNSRETHRSWHPSITLALGRRFIMARYLVGDSMAALRLAEDIVYNCRRVHGTRHANSLEMSIFLTQLYTSVAQRYQKEKAGQDMANRYYKKSAAIHENILRVFSDPSYAEMESDLDSSMCIDGIHGGDIDRMSDSSKKSYRSDAAQVRQHLKLLKLAVQRLGSWPKDFSEYQRLSADVFHEFGNELKGVDGVEKWNPGKFGSGNAESNEDLIDPKFNSWELLDPETSGSGMRE